MQKGWRILVVLVLPLVAACGGDDHGQTAITFWHFWPKPAIEPFLDEFETQNPGLRVESQQLTWQSGFEKIVLAFASGTPPDLCEIGSTWVARFAADGSLWGLPENPSVLEEEYFLVEPGVFEGRVFALPWLVGTRALFFNRRLFREAGLDPDDPPETWSELLGAARRIDAWGETHGKNIHGYGTNAGERHVLYKKFLPFAWSNGGRILADDGSSVLLDSEENLEALRFFLSLVEVSLVEKQAVLDQVFKEGRIGMLISGSWNLKGIPEEAPDLEYGVTLVPRPDKSSGRHVSFGGCEMLAIPVASGNREAALRLARHLLRSDVGWRIAMEVQSVWPSSRKAGESAPDLSPEAEIFILQMQTARTTPTHPRWMEMEQVIDSHLERALYGRVTPEEALREAHERVEEIVKR